jgi:hypothetical protein
MKVHGSCHCGALAFEAEIDPARAVICHCSDCQKLSATAFRVNVGAPEASFRMLRGTPRIYVKVAESGNRRQQAFCETCGSHIYATSDEAPGNRALGLRVGTLDERRELVPARQIWCDSAMPWVEEMPATKVARQ